MDSLLNQKTNFDYEILIGEDCSDDSTREICIDYANRFPEKIRLFLHNRENNIKINEFHTGRFNVLYNLYSSKGKYIAFCEGDDFWLDEFKLEKQLKIISGQNTVVLSNYYYLHNQKFIDSELGLGNNKNILKIDLNKLATENYHFSHTSSYLFPSNYLKNIFSHDWLCRSWGLDTILLPIFFENGQVLYHPDKLTVYRINNNGLSRIKEVGSGDIHKYKALQYSNLLKIHPVYHRFIEYRKYLAFFTYFNRTADWRFLNEYIDSILYLKNFRLKIFKSEIQKLIKTIIRKYII